MEDIDERITRGLDSKSSLAVVFTVARLFKILLPYTEEKQLSYFEINLFHSFFSSIQWEDKPPIDLPAVNKNQNKEENSNQKTKVTTHSY